MITIEPMLTSHIGEVAEVERESFTSPWTYEMLLTDLASGITSYFVAVSEGKVIGYCGMWRVLDEGQITNVAVRATHRGRGVGSALMAKLTEEAERLSLSCMTLEVRRSNAAAIALYDKQGFVQNGIRRGYYQDTNEDALLMIKEVKGQTHTI